MSAAAHAAQMVDIGGYSLAIRCMGHGSPVVVIDAGLGEGSAAWTTLQTRVATFTQVCTYDRAGVGQSDPGPTPRTSQQMVAELRTLLRKASVEGPYVVVGHSLGGLNAQLFAMQYPHDTAGLVLIDPSFPDMLTRFAAVLPEAWLPLWNSQFESAAEGMTQADLATSCAQVGVAGKLPNVPLMVLSAGQPVQLPPEYSTFPAADVLREMQVGHAVLTSTVPHGQHLIVENSSHATMHLQDDVIVDAIHQVVAAAR